MSKIKRIIVWLSVFFVVFLGTWTPSYAKKYIYLGVRTRATDLFENYGIKNTHYLPIPFSNHVYKYMTKAIETSNYKIKKVYLEKALYYLEGDCDEKECAMSYQESYEYAMVNLLYANIAMDYQDNETALKKLKMVAHILEVIDKSSKNNLQLAYTYYFILKLTKEDSSYEELYSETITKIAENQMGLRFTHKTFFTEIYQEFAYYYRKSGYVARAEYYDRLVEKRLQRKVKKLEKRIIKSLS